MKLENYFKNGKIKVWKETFSIVKSKKSLADAFAVVKDKKELTVVIDESKIRNNKDIIKLEEDWKLLTFDVELPFNLVGFLAKVSKALAEEKISIFVISAYSTDHILVKEKNLKVATSKLKSLGFKFT